MSTTLIKPVFDSIPSELTDLPQWVLWKSVSRVKKNGVSTNTKVPYSARTRSQVSITDQSELSTFDDACVEYLSSDFSGIGFVLLPAGEITAIDLDSCISDGVIADWAMSIVRQCESYTEISVSGTGLHIFLIGRLPHGISGRIDNQRGIEMYCEQRYLTITGKTIPGFTRMRDSQVTIDLVFDNYFGTVVYDEVKIGDYDFDPDAPITAVEDMPVSEAVKAMITDGRGMDKYKDKNGGEDRSLALFHVTEDLIYAGVNKESILVAFTDARNYLGKAALERRGHDVESARRWLWQYTIAKVHGRHHADIEAFRDLEEADFGLDLDSPGFDSITDACPVKEATKPRKIDWTGVPFDKTNYERNASLFMKHTPCFRVSKVPYIWDSMCYRRSNDDVLERRVTEALMKRNFPLSTMNAAITMIKRRTAVDRMIRTPGIMSCLNGMINLRPIWKGEMPVLMEHSPKFHCTSVSGFVYDPDAKCPLFMKVLNEWCNDDPVILRSLVQAAGLMITNNTSFHKIFVFEGKSRSGKGVLTSIITALVGEDAFSGTSLNAMAGPHGTASLVDKNIISVGDARQAFKGLISAVLEILLNIAGGDKVDINPKGAASYSEVIRACLLISTNQLPRFSDPQDALLNRLHVIPFRRTFFGREDRGLTEKLMKELPGIFNLFIGGAIDAVKNGLVESEEGQEYKAEVRKMQNNVGHFADTYMVITGDPDDRVEVEEVYTTYLKFCHSEEFAPKSRNQFGRELKAHTGVDNGRMLVSEGRSRAYIGAKMKDEEVKILEMDDWF